MHFLYFAQFLTLTFLYLAVPDEPKGPLRFSDLDETSVTLSWSPPLNDGGAPVKSYQVESWSKDRAWMEMEKTDARTTTLCTQRLSTGTTYRFRVCAINRVGAGKFLESDRITPAKELSKSPEIHNSAKKMKKQKRKKNKTQKFFFF